MSLRFFVARLARAALLAGFVVALAILILGAVPACAGADRAPSSEEVLALERAAAAAYGREHVACAKPGRTNAEINACRDEVRRRWGVVETSRDAGADR